MFLLEFAWEAGSRRTHGHRPGKPPRPAVPARPARWRSQPRQTQQPNAPPSLPSSDGTPGPGPKAPGRRLRDPGWIPMSQVGCHHGHEGHQRDPEAQNLSTGPHIAQESRSEAPEEIQTWTQADPTRPILPGSLQTAPTRRLPSAPGSPDAAPQGTLRSTRLSCGLRRAR